MREEYFHVLEGGLMTTLQDEGRRGFKKYGIPVSGPMDRDSFYRGNELLTNKRGAVGLEFTFPGPRLISLRDIVCAITGADFTPLCNGDPLPSGEVFLLSKGSELSFSALKKGRWSYLLVSGGLYSPMVLGSSSTYPKEQLGGMGRSLKKGDILYGKKGVKGRELLGRRFSSFLHPIDTDTMIRVLPGPQFHLFTPSGIETFFQSEYQIGMKWDRMGYFLEGPPVEAKDSLEIISEGLTPGAIQILGDGTPVVMMADAQTIGGYKKIGWILQKDQSTFAQLQRGETFRFHRVSRIEAQKTLKERPKYDFSSGKTTLMKIHIDGMRFNVGIEEVDDGREEA